ncbi:MAG: 7-carboxy-7-deazaguanine synthase QueE [Proteobacteria bacterium]|nr:MAG: 7-carboxy-7-deazaguanine synthase QueE [Pseudomonadota bacterium]QKK11913.1 MAG: 7-carboxy-7-deazaguanine synthase QueE [Pseudomonadota bacterium]
MCSLRITEIFYSLQGEGLSAGEPTVFVRLTGCPLRCAYCDTSYAFQGGEWMTLADIRQRIAEFDCRQICVTGGEPLAQPNCQALLRQLCDAGYTVSLETSGALDVGAVDSRVIKVMDLKTPGSGEVGRNRLQNLEYLAPTDQLKFVLCDRTDYEWARRMVEQHGLAQRCTLLFSPAAGQLDPRALAEWVLEDHLSVRLQLQLHKLIWGDTPGH